LDSEKKMRTLTQILYYGAAWFLPGAPVPGYRFGYAVRRALARGFLAQCGRGVEIKAKVYFGRGRGIRLGDRCRLGKNCVLNPGVVVGSDTLISPEVVIYTLMHRFESREIPVRDQGYHELLPVVIGPDVWVGSRSIILPGITIGQGAIVGAGSVVTRDVESWAIVAGNPARFVGWRGTDESSEVAASGLSA
jgi:maltose O-acetyltransferase